MTRFALGSIGLILALSVLLSLGVGPTLDDYMHAARIAEGGTLTLYDFFGANDTADHRFSGFLHFWADPALSIRFFRPLSSAVLAFDHVLLDGGGLYSHVHGLCWYAALVYVVHVLLSELLGAESARFATPLYAVANWHAVPLAFTAARHAHVTAVFAFCAFYAFCLSARGSPKARWFSAALLGLGLLAGESALLVAPMAIGWCVARCGLRRTLHLALPLLLVCATYVFAYASSGYGTRASGTYLNPLSLEFVEQLPLRWLALVADLFGALANDVTLFGLWHAQLAWGLASLAAAVAAVRWLSNQEPIGFRACLGLGAGALVSLLAASAAMPGGRGLVVPGLAASALFGAVARACVQNSAATCRRWLMAWVVTLGIGLHPVFRLAIPLDFKRLGHELVQWSRELSEHCQGKVVLALGAADPVVVYPPFVQEVLDWPRLRALHVLSISNHRHELRRTGLHRYELEIAGNFFEHPWSRIQRARPLELGSFEGLDGLSISVLEAHGPTRLELALESGLEPCWVTRTPHGLERFRPPDITPKRWTPGN